jgi:hypothetical protein
MIEVHEFRPSPAITFTIDWPTLEQELTNLALTPALKAQVSYWLGDARTQAPFLPSSHLLRELLCMAFAIGAADSSTERPGDGAMS